MLSVGEYLKKNPEATLKEYYDFIESEKLKKDLEESELRINIYEWHKIRDGKYFKISNHSSFKIFQFKCPPLEYFRRDESKFIKVHGVCSCNFYSEGISIDVHPVETILLHMLGCPYCDGISNIEEISEEKYKEIIKNAKDNIKKWCLK